MRPPFRLPVVLLALGLLHCGGPSDVEDADAARASQPLEASACVPAARVAVAGRILGLEEMRAVGRRLFFFVFDAPHGWALWRSDGTPAGTAKVADVGPPDGSARPRAPVESGGLLFFQVGEALWRSDGTAPGTRPIDVPELALAYPRMEYRGRLLVIRSVPGGDELWLTDGTRRGSRRILGPPFTFTLGPAASDLVETARGDLVFEARGADGGLRLLRLTRSGALVELFREPRSNVSITQLTAVGNRLFFFTDPLEQGEPSHLWSSDGTPGGAVLAGRFGLGFVPIGLTAFKGRLFFTARAEDGSGGAELWVSDGTPRGTRLFVDLRPGAMVGSLPTNLTVVKGRLYFVADDGEHGRELWVTDGTVRGTRLVVDLRPGAESSWPYGLAAIDGHLYFAADDGVHGVEPWRLSQGRARLAADVLPGEGSSYPEPTVGIFDAPGRAFVQAGGFVFLLSRSEEVASLWALKAGSRCPGPGVDAGHGP
ncbi:ELWxxDGT repeat protein [Pyxidicoccus sp. 3LFB2]